jgi:hypothetical protein
MMAHFREDWERIVLGGYDKSLEEMLLYRRSLPREGLMERTLNLLVRKSLLTSYLSMTLNINTSVTSGGMESITVLILQLKPTQEKE